MDLKNAKALFTGGGTGIGLETARLIRAAGGEATLQRWDEGIHVFQMLGTPESDDAIAKIVTFAKQHLS